MTSNGFPADRLNRILAAVETIEESLGILASKQQLSRDRYKADPETRDIVERRFVKMTKQRSISAKNSRNTNEDSRHRAIQSQCVY